MNRIGIASVFLLVGCGGQAASLPEDAGVGDDVSSRGSSSDAGPDEPEDAGPCLGDCVLLSDAAAQCDRVPGRHPFYSCSSAPTCSDCYAWGDGKWCCP
jgi:hypothetical protein